MPMSEFETDDNYPEPLAAEWQQLREAQQAFAEHKRRAQQVLSEQRSDLERQVERVVDQQTRLQELAERSVDEEIESLRQQVRDLQYQVELCHAERDAAFTELEQL